MKLFKINVALFLVVIYSVSAYASSTCDSYINKTIKPLSVEVFWKKISAVPVVKNEFETTANFNERVHNYISSIDGGDVIIEVPVQREFIKYDADLNKLYIEKFAFSNGTTKYNNVFGYGTIFYEKIKYGSSDNINIVFPSKENKIGSYIGVTALGAKIRVNKIKRLTRAIFEREAQWMESTFYDEPKSNNAIIYFDEINPEKAMDIKKNARAAIVISPKSPYFAKGKYPWGSPTIDGPIEIDETIEVVIADIQCALLLNADGNVDKAVETK